ncbi:hypothetical protein N7540_013032 [Penicillium herquei]|nr:hypothetical protein N7540_013032 [Penicillium herquei]
MKKKIKARDKQSPVITDAWVLGIGTASLASAYYLVRDGKIPAHRVHILDAHESEQQILHVKGDSYKGYDQFAGCLPLPIGAPLKQFLGSIPSIDSPDRTVQDEIRTKKGQTHLEASGDTRFLVHTDRRFHDIPTNSLGLGIKNRLDLISFILKGEKRLGRDQIKDFLPSLFFQSTFWAIWSAQFGFQPWHSATEFRRTLLEYLEKFHSLNIVTCLDITGYYQYESIFLPIYAYLRSLGVDFQFDTKVTNVTLATRDGHQVISRLDMIQRGFQRCENFEPSTVVFIEPGSTVTGSAIGTDSCPPVWYSLHAEEELDEKWALWLELACKSTKFGNPYNFCTRQNESILESFTVTTKDLGFFEHLRCLSKDLSNAGAFFILRESRWRLNICVPDQPVFSNQPEDVRVIWGFALFPHCKGDCVHKSMLQCSGAEIMAELLYHLGLPNILIQHTITVPRVMPRMTSLLLAHSVHDRPLVSPLSTSNIGLVGPFVDIPRYSCVDMSYGVRTAQMAVSQLMDLNSQQRTQAAPLVSSVLRILFWK